MSGALIVPTPLSKRFTVPLYGVRPLIMPRRATTLRRSFDASSTTFSNCLPGTQAQGFPHGRQTRGICISLFRKDILGIIAALVVNAAPASEQHETSIKFREGLALWLRVLGLLSRREAEWIDAASELWPSALRQRLNSALHQHGRSGSRSSPFRCTFFPPGLKYINQFEFRSLSAVNEAEQQNSGI
ncbi:MAG: hypothetical protein QOE55_3672 [Acidobacteriaceae bacterium]|jgi:hypothetical protein|nr:hypothetical protein [Acidobacteriaceae bacterium]